MNKLTALSLIFLLNPVTMAAATESYYHRYGESPAIPTIQPQSNAPVYTERTLTPPYAATLNTQVSTAQQPVPQAIVQRPTQATPNAAHYGFYGQKSIQGSGPRYIVGGNPYAPSDKANHNSYYNSPVFADGTQARRRSNKLYYLAFRAGAGSTLGWDNGQKKPIKSIFGLVAGTWLTQDVRLDAEFDYHMKGKLFNTAARHTTYKQYDLGANVYYDFAEIQYGLRPFIGGGLWFVKKKISDTAADDTTKSSSGWRTGFSASAGVTYPITDAFSLSAMVRGRYIVTSDSIYNLEALFGAQYAF